jgi:hypothetical protein
MSALLETYRNRGHPLISKKQYQNSLRPRTKPKTSIDGSKKSSHFNMMLNPNEQVLLISRGICLIFDQKTPQPQSYVRSRRTPLPDVREQIISTKIFLALMV